MAEIFHTLFMSLIVNRYKVFFHLEGNLSSFIQSLKVIDSSLWIDFAQIFIIHILSISRQWDFYGFKSLVVLEMLLVEEIIESRDLFVSSGILFGKSLLLFNECTDLQKMNQKV